MDTITCSLAQVDGGDNLWPSVVVAIAIMALIGVVMGFAIAKGGVDGGMKMWGGLGPIVGLLVGAIGTFFFTRQATVTATRQAVTARVLSESAVAQAEKAEAALTEEQQRVEILEKDVKAKLEELQRVSRENPNLHVKPEVLTLPKTFDRGLLRRNPG